MDDRRFDALTRALGQGGSRRALLKGLLGLGGMTTASATLLRETDAARRGQSGPAVPTALPTLAVPATQPPAPLATSVPQCPGIQTPCGADCCCPPGNTKCGPDCCADGEAECCGNACCLGTCYGEELCCPPGSRVCDGGCYPGGCCSDADCGGACLVCGSDHVCRSCADSGQCLICDTGSGTCIAGCPTGFVCQGSQCVVDCPSGSTVCLYTEPGQPLPNPTCCGGGSFCDSCEVPGNCVCVPLQGGGPAVYCPPPQFGCCGTNPNGENTCTCCTSGQTCDSSGTAGSCNS